MRQKDHVSNVRHWTEVLVGHLRDRRHKVYDKGFSVNKEKEPHEGTNHLIQKILEVQK